MTSDESYGKKERLVKTKEFRKLYKEGRSFKADFIILKTLPNNLSTNRIGFSISAKAVRKAFRRNRIRRLFREAYRRNKKVLRKGFDLALIIRKDPGVRFSYQAAEKIFLKLNKEANILS